MTGTPDAIELPLSADEALILFDLLSRWTNESDQPSPDPGCFESSAECATLHRVLGGLELQLIAPFQSDYTEMVAAARTHLAGEWEGLSLRA